MEVELVIANSLKKILMRLPNFTFLDLCSTHRTKSFGIVAVPDEITSWIFSAGIEIATDKKYDIAWHRRTKFDEAAGLNEVFLDNIGEEAEIHLG